jgi:transposase-like protein
MTNQAKEKYTVEFKENAVKRANESNNIAEIARKLGLCRGNGFMKLSLSRI